MTTINDFIKDGQAREALYSLDIFGDPSISDEIACAKVEQWFQTVERLDGICHVNIGAGLGSLMEQPRDGTEDKLCLLITYSDDIWTLDKLSEEIVKTASAFNEAHSRSVIGGGSLLCSRSP